MANSQELGRKIATTSPGASPAEMRPRARDSTRLPYSAKVRRRLQEVSISDVLPAFWRQLWRTTSWAKRPVGSAYSWVRSIVGDCKGGVQKLKVTLPELLSFCAAWTGEPPVPTRARSSSAEFSQEFLFIHVVLKRFAPVDEDDGDLVRVEAS